jgi:hypothetical protein
MPYLFETNVFLRLASSHDPALPLAMQAFQELRKCRETFCYMPQVLAEFWSVATRSPSARGGLGLSPTDAERRARVIERYFRLLPDSLATFTNGDSSSFVMPSSVPKPMMPRSSPP